MSAVIGFNKLNGSVQWNDFFCFWLRTVIMFCFVLFSFLQKLDIIPRKPKRLREDQIICQNFSQNIWVRVTLWTRLDISFRKRWWSVFLTTCLNNTNMLNYYCDTNTENFKQNVNILTRSNCMSSVAFVLFWKPIALLFQFFPCESRRLPPAKRCMWNFASSLEWHVRHEHYFTVYNASHLFATAVEPRSELIFSEIWIHSLN